MDSQTDRYIDRQMDEQTDRQKQHLQQRWMRHHYRGACSQSFVGAKQFGQEDVERTERKMDTSLIRLLLPGFGHYGKTFTKLFQQGHWKMTERMHFKIFCIFEKILL